MGHGITVGDDTFLSATDVPVYAYDVAFSNGELHLTGFWKVSNLEGI